MVARPILCVVLLISTAATAEGRTPVDNLQPYSTAVSVSEMVHVLDALTGRPTARAARNALNLSGDGASDSFLILSAANVAGMNGSFYKTELAILPQWKSSKIKVDIFAVPNNTAPLSSPGSVKGGVFTLEGGHIYRWDNILNTLGLSGAGYILVGIDSSVYDSSSFLMAAWANTYTTAPTGGYFRTPVPVFTDPSLFTSYDYCHDNVRQDTQARNNIVLYNVDTSMNLTIDVYFSPWSSSDWGSPVRVTLSPGESRQYSLSSLFPGVTGDSSMYFSYISGGHWLGYIVRTDNGTNDGLLELPYRDNYSYWPN